MRKTVHSKLICSYIFIGIVGFLFATVGGSHFVETYLEEEVGARLYDSAVRFASDAVTVQSLFCISKASAGNAHELRKSLPLWFWSFSLQKRYPLEEGSYL